MSKEIDALVAEHVMGWDTRMQPEGCQVHIPGVRGFDAGPWSPSTDWRAAGEVVEKMAEADFWMDMADMRHGCYRTDGGDPFVGWRVEVCDVDREDEHGPIPVSHVFDGEETWTAEAETLPMAICLAALKAKGVEVPS